MAETDIKKDMAGKKIRILVVDDDEIVENDIKDKLEKFEGYEVCGTATTGDGAIEQVDLNKPDMVLMDIVLKGDMDGIDAARVIQSRYNIPVIYLTAYSDEEKLKRAKVTEPFGYIIKPFNERELHSTIEMAMYKHKAEEERRKLIAELRDALAEVKTLRGCLPICASCKKIRDDKGYWRQIEKYLMDNTDVDFTHGICPECSKKFSEG